MEAAISPRARGIIRSTIADVRIARPDDAEEIFRLLAQSHGENGLFPYDLNKVNWWIARFLHPELIEPWDTGPRGVIGVIGKKHLEGMAILTIGMFWYSSQRHLEEFIVYVDPGHRKKGHQKALIEWMKQQSALTGLKLITGILSNHRTEAKVRLYEQSLPKAGAFFVFDPAITLGSSAVAVH